MADQTKVEPRLQRLLGLVELLGGRRWTVRELLELFDISRTVLYEDLQILRRVLPLRNLHGRWWLDADSLHWPLTLTEEEVAALTVAVTAAAVNSRTPYAQPLQRVLLKLRRPLPERLQEALESYQRKVAMVEPSGRSFAGDTELFARLDEATLEQRVVVGKYRRPGADFAPTYRLRPYALRWMEGRWYCLAALYRPMEPIPWRVDRFEEVEVTEERFDLPEGFDVDEYIDRHWGRFLGGEPKDVVLRIAAAKAYLVEETERHPSQHILGYDADESVLVRYHVPIDGDFAWWVLSLGEHVTVLHPSELKAYLYRTGQALVEKYRSEMEATGLADGEAY